MSFDQTEWVWMNGRTVPWSEARLHVSSHGLHMGSGVFEGIRCYVTDDGPAIFRMDAHLDRLYASAAVYDIEIPYSREELEQAICETIHSNGFGSCYIRLICYYGSGSLGIYPRDCPVEVAILTWPWGAYLGSEGVNRGVRVSTSACVKFHSRMMPTTAKACGQYLNSMLALREALSRHCDEAILLDVNGNVAEGSGENIFIVSGEEVLTNDEQSSILPGITRDSVMTIAGDLGYCARVTTFKLEDLLLADEAFFTGTAAEVTPIREVDGRQIGRTVPGEVTRRIQRMYFDAVSGREARYRDWLHLVESAVPHSTHGAELTLSDRLRTPL